MINEEELRALLEIEGYSQEQADEIRATHDYRAIVSGMQAVWDALTAIANQFAAELAGALEELADTAYTPEPKKKHPRPPRYAGPRNKGRSWTPAPPRVARSDCRRYRR
jgi:hypothetical protein